jgi:hypothetical protein
MLVSLAQLSITAAFHARKNGFVGKRILLFSSTVLKMAQQDATVGMGCFCK